MNRTRKNVFLTLVIVLLLLTACRNQKVVPEDTQLTSLSKLINASYVKDANRASIAVGVNGDIYLTDEHRIYVLDSKGNKKKVIENTDKLYYYSLESTDNGFFAYNAKSFLEEYDLNGNKVKEYNIFTSDQYTQYRMLKMAYMNKKMYFMYEGYDTGQHYLAEYDLNKEVFKEIDIENFNNFTKYKENKLLIFLHSNCCSGHMIEYNTQTGEISDEFHILNMPRSGTYFYNEKEDDLYVFNHGKSDVISMSKKQVIQTLNTSFIPQLFTCYFVNNTGYFFDRNSKLITVAVMDEMVNNAAIVVMTNDIFPGNYYDRIAVEYSRKNNGKSINTLSYSIREYDTKLNTALMAGDYSFDIFVLSSYNEPLGSYIRKGVCEDLNAYPNISNKFDDMFEGIRELCTYNGTLFGVPVGLLNMDNVYVLNLEMIDALNIEIPRYDWTWNDFEKYAEVVCANGNNYMMKNEIVVFWISHIDTVLNCINMEILQETVTHDINGIAAGLEYVKKLYDRNIILNKSYFEDKDNDKNLFLQFTVLPTYEIVGKKIIPAPTWEDKRVYPFRVTYLCINRKSKNKEAAAAFLEECISKEAQANDALTGGPILYKDKSVYETSKYKEFVNDKWNYEVYSYMLKNSRRLESYSILQNYLDYVKSFFAGEITAEEAAKAIYNKLKMIVEE